MHYCNLGWVCAWLLLFATAASTTARDYFTEVFSSDFDLGSTTFTFKPDRSSNGYAVCRLPATELPTPPTNQSSQLYIFEPYRLPLEPNVVALYGERYSDVWVNTNGSITFGATDPDGTASVSNHFRLPRVSAGLGMLGPSIHVRVLSNLVALTWMANESSVSNQVQVELFYDGVIRLTFLRVDPPAGIVGLSAGRGVPADFAESNLSAIGCAGQALYELLWSGTPTAVQAGQPFPVTLSGRDAFNLDFPVNGPARLSTVAPRILFQADFEQGASGFTFSNAPGNPGSNLWHLSTERGMQTGHSPVHSMKFGTADNVPPVNIPAAAGLLVSPLIDLRQAYPPITLSFNHLASFIYAETAVMVQRAGSTNWPREAVGGFNFSLSTTNQWITSMVDLSAYAGQQIRVSFFANTNGWSGVGIGFSSWLVDDITITGLASNGPVTPALTGLFNGSSWAGNISVGTPGAIRFLASHSNGVYGLSAPVEVATANDLILRSSIKDPYLQIGRLSSVDILVSNTGPDNATSVIVTNQLPAGVTLGNVVLSQGSATINGNNLLLNFGNIGGASCALASFEFSPVLAGTLSFTSVVARAGNDALLENNRSVVTLTVGAPLVNASSIILSESAGAALFTLHLDSASPEPVSVRFETVSATATAGQDFMATNGFVTFAPSTTNAQIAISVIDDDLFDGQQSDPPEFFYLHLISATNAAIDTPFVTASLVDDDPAPVLTVTSTNILEGDAGTTFATLIFQLSKPAGTRADVTYMTRTGIAFDPIANYDRTFGTVGGSDPDFIPTTATFYFEAGETQRVVLIPIVGDTIPEPNENFTVVVSSHSLLPISPIRPRPPWLLYPMVTIIDDDPPILSLDDYEVTLENCGTNKALDPGETVTVLLRVRNIGYNACTSSNLIATLLPQGGVLNPSGPQNYGVLCGAADGTRPFSFTVGADCGSTLTATLAFTDNGTNRGAASLPIPVGLRPLVFHEDFETTTPPNLPAGWQTFSANAFWSTATNASQTNRFAEADYFNTSENAAELRSPAFVITSTNAWVKIRHRFEVPVAGAQAYVNLSSNDFVLNGYNMPVGWNGSSRGWMTSLAQLAPTAAGTTQYLQFTLYMGRGTSARPIWEIDSVEVFDGPAACCENGAPFLSPARREGNNLVVQWNSIPGRSYQLQFRSSLSPATGWNDLGPPIVASGSLTTRTNTISGSSGFYRVRLNP